MRIHRAADVEEQQHLDAVAALGPQLHIEPSGVARRALDRRVEIELVGHALPREAPQSPQRDLDVARVDLDGVVQVAERALVPDLDRAAAATALLADAYPFGVVAVGAERARARGADPFRSTLVPSALLVKPPAECLHQLIPAAESGDQRLLLVGQIGFDHLAQPRFRNVGVNVEHALDALEICTEREIETVVERLVLDQAGARQKIEVIDAGRYDVMLQRVEQRQKLARADRQLRRFEMQEKVDQQDRYRGRSSRNCQMPPDRRPFAVDDAEYDGVALRAVGQQLVVAQHAVLLGAEPLDRDPRSVIEPVRPKFHRDAAQHLERMRQQQQLAFGVDRRALRALRIPGVPDLEPPVGRDRH